jgi:predicted RNA-binding protein with PUA-like domain
MAKRYWLMKSEPYLYGIDDLERDGDASWDGVRNFQARNMMRDQMQIGDRVLFYHSNADPPGVAGTAEISRRAYADLTALDPESDYHDPKATEEDPRWLQVDVRFVEKFDRVVPLATLRETAGLEDMLVIRRGMRLSIQPLTRDQFWIVTRIGRRLGAA